MFSLCVLVLPHYAALPVLPFVSLCARTEMRKCDANALHDTTRHRARNVTLYIHASVRASVPTIAHAKKNTVSPCLHGAMSAVCPCHAAQFGRVCGSYRTPHAPRPRILSSRRAATCLAKMLPRVHNIFMHARVKVHTLERFAFANTKRTHNA